MGKSRVLDAIGKTTTWIVDVEISGVKTLWKVKRISSADMIRQAHAMLLALPSKVEQQRGDAEVADEVVGDLASALAQDPEPLIKLTDHVDAITCAALLAVSPDDGVTWESIQAVGTEAEADHDKGRVWVEDLPPEVRGKIAHSVQSNAGRQAKAFETFRK